jgi:hypothetical protein
LLQVVAAVVFLERLCPVFKQVVAAVPAVIGQALLIVQKVFPQLSQ